MSDMDVEIGAIGATTAPVFAARGWGYLADNHTPTAAELASVIRGLLAELQARSEGDPSYEGGTATGRFHVELGPDEDDPETIHWSVSLVVGSGSYKARRKPGTVEEAQ